MLGTVNISRLAVLSGVLHTAKEKFSVVIKKLSNMMGRDACQIGQGLKGSCNTTSAPKEHLVH